MAKQGTSTPGSPAPPGHTGASYSSRAGRRTRGRPARQALRSSELPLMNVPRDVALRNGDLWTDEVGDEGGDVEIEVEGDHTDVVAQDADHLGEKSRPLGPVQRAVEGRRQLVEPRV